MSLPSFLSILVVFPSPGYIIDSSKWLSASAILWDFVPQNFILYSLYKDHRFIIADACGDELLHLFSKDRNDI